MDRDEAGLQELASSLPASCEVSRHGVDLAELGGLDDLAAAVVDRHGGAHVLINNAGLTVHGAFEDYSAADIDRVLDVDLRAPLHLVRAFLPHLVAAAPAHVVNVASLAGLSGFPFQSTYSAAKFALRGFGQALRPELAARGIGVTTVLPGTVATPFLRTAASHDRDTSDRLARLMMNHGAPPARVARAIERAIRRDRAVVRVGWDCHAVAWCNQLCPPLIPWVLRLAYRGGWLGAKVP